MDRENSFEYTYSAPQQKEIQKIRRKYLPKEQAESKLDELRRLDRSAEKPGTVVSLILGVLGTLIFGAGMSCVLVLPHTEYFVWGIVIGLAGMVILALAYPVYKWMTKKRRAKIAPRILELTEELTEI